MVESATATTQKQNNKATIFSGIYGKIKSENIEEYTTTVLAFPYQQEQETRSCFLNSINPQRNKSNSLVSIIAKRKITHQLVKDTQNTIAHWVILSATGSINLPRSVTILKRLAINPSATSVIADKTIKPADQ